MVNQDLMTNVPGIFSCGNVLHVHDLADNATFAEAAERAGATAASWANSMYVDEDLESREGAAANVDPASSAETLQQRRRHSRLRPAGGHLKHG